MPVHSMEMLCRRNNEESRQSMAGCCPREDFSVFVYSTVSQLHQSHHLLHVSISVPPFISLLFFI